MKENKQPRVKILVACHKADPNIRQDDIYMPIQGGQSAPPRTRPRIPMRQHRRQHLREKRLLLRAHRPLLGMEKSQGHRLHRPLPLPPLF